MAVQIKADSIPSIDEDLLGRFLFAKEIKDAIIAYSKRNKDAFTLSITGEWGSGKSTLLSYVKTLLQNEETASFKVIEFNPWMFYKNESIKQSFLVELAISLKDFETGRTKLSAHLKDFIGAFNWIKYVNSTAGNIQEGLNGFFDFLGKADSINDIFFAARLLKKPCARQGHCGFLYVSVFLYCSVCLYLSHLNGSPLHEIVSTFLRAYRFC